MLRMCVVDRFELARASSMLISSSGSILVLGLKACTDYLDNNCTGYHKLCLHGIARNQKCACIRQAMIGCQLNYPCNKNVDTSSVLMATY